MAGKIVLQERIVLQHGCTVAKNCIAIGNGLYCREGGLMVELYCNTIGCIVNRRLQGWWLEVYCNTIIVLQLMSSTVIRLQ